MKEILSTYKGKARLVIKHMPYKYRDFAFIAAEATLAALDQDKFWEMHWMLHEHFPRLDRESLISYARELGLDMKRFVRDLDDMKHIKHIQADLKLSRDLDLYSTPAFFINGIKAVGNRPFESFRMIIDGELQRLGEPLPEGSL